MKYEEFLSVIAKGDITEEVTKEAKRLLKVHEKSKERQRKSKINRIPFFWCTVEIEKRKR